MNTFNELFDKWASSYDDTVYGTDNEYIEVFENYDLILKTIQENINDKKERLVLEIGVGTGNLLKNLYENGFNVIGIEPSVEMRKVSIKKLPNVKILNGHFLDIPLDYKFDAIVSSYAFHHLTYEEKKKAIKYLDGLLNDNGKIVISDTMFESKEYKNSLYKHVEKSNAFNLLNDLKTEFYEYLQDILILFTELNYYVEAKKINKYVWVITAYKGGNVNE